MNIAYSKNPDFYEFKNKYNNEFIFFKWGIVLSNTPKSIQKIDKYNIEEDKIETAKGYIRTSKFYKLINKFPYIKEDSRLTQTILEV